MLVKIHRQNRQFAERNVRYLEGLFKTTSKLEDPERWLILQDKLGDAYKQLMQLEGESAIRYGLRSKA